MKLQTNKQKNNFIWKKTKENRHSNFFAHTYIPQVAQKLKTIYKISGEKKQQKQYEQFELKM